MAEDQQNKAQPLTSDQLLEEAAARNCVLELHRSTGVMVIPTARARILAVDDSTIYLDTPQTIGREVRLSEGQLFECYFNLYDTIFMFTSAITNMHSAVQLNDQKVVEGITIQKPVEVRSGQRRKNFRVSLAFIDPVPVHMHLTDWQNPDQCPIEVRPLRGVLMDASAGGFGVRLERSGGSSFNVFDHFFVNFNIPGGPGVTLLAELRQIRPLRNGESTKLGLMALPWPDLNHLNRQMMPLERFLVQLQRKFRGAA